MRFALIFIISLLVACGGDDSETSNSNAATDAGIADAAGDSGFVDANSPDEQDAESGDASVDAGESRTPCDLSAATDTCPDGEGCKPIIREDFDQQLEGECWPLGTLQKGEACDRTSEQGLCAADLVCVENECIEFCDPEPEPGTESCPAGLGCYPIFEGEVYQAFGVCKPTCEFNHDDRLNPTVACPGPDESCVPGEIFGFDFDACRETPMTLDEGAYCEDAGLQQGELCGVNSLCVIYMGSRVRCRDLCFVTEAPFGSSNHPDCRNPGDVCVQAMNNDQTGICETLPGG